jgi:hypothetical protein
MTAYWGSGIGRHAIHRPQDTMDILGWPKVAIAYRDYLYETIRYGLTVPGPLTMCTCHRETLNVGDSRWA